MMKKSSGELENLIFGKTDCVEILATPENLSREHIIEELNSILFSVFPGCWLNGEFMNKDNGEYLVYELHFSGIHKLNTTSCIRLIDFGDRFKLIRFQ